MEKRYHIALSFATEDQELVEKVYHYLKAESLKVFFAPVQECQKILSGRSQREIFYEIFGLLSEYAALFVSKDYIRKEVPMEEAGIAFAKKGDKGKVIPVYLDETTLPEDMFDPKQTNYFKSRNPAQIAAHLAAKIKWMEAGEEDGTKRLTGMNDMGNAMYVTGTSAKKVVQINKNEGDIYL